MFQQIGGSLYRQARALELLKSLMQEEFSFLTSNNIDKITEIEFSIHALLRQIADEKEFVIKSLGGGKVMDFAQMLPEDQQVQLQNLFKDVDRAEQACAKQASFNAEVSLAMIDQGERLMKELTRLATPKKPQVYGKKGAYQQNVRPDAMLISGRL